MLLYLLLLLFFYLILLERVKKFNDCHVKSTILQQCPPQRECTDENRLIVPSLSHSSVPVITHKLLFFNLVFHPF